jgi:hypothetical protein
MREFPSDAPSAGSGALADVTPIDSPARRTLFRALLIIVAIEPLVIVGVLIAVGIPWRIVLALLAALLVIIAGVAWLIVFLMWKPLMRRYPPQPFLSGAVSKSWQSFAFGPLMRMNNCLTIVADEQCLHLRPFAPMQWLGAGWISLPVNRIAGVQPGMFGQLSAFLDGRMIAGPAWCLNLAAGALGEATAESPSVES